MLLCFLHSKTQRQCIHFVGAEHFPLENVQLCKNAFDAILLKNVTNAFDAKMHLMQKCCVFCFAKNKDAALTFCLQNVRKRQNAFWRTFSKGKCSATLCKNAFDAKMHLMQKCI